MSELSIPRDSLGVEREENWFDEEAEPLGNLLGVEYREKEKLNALLEDLNLDFGRWGKKAKRQGSRSDKEYEINGDDVLTDASKIFKLEYAWFEGVRKTIHCQENGQEISPTFCWTSRNKEEYISITIARLVWGNQPHKWSFVPANGASRGIALLWDCDRLEVHEILKGMFTFSVLCNVVGEIEGWVCSCVYGPRNPNQKADFWNELEAINKD